MPIAGFAILLAGVSRAHGRDFPTGFGWQNLEFRTYAPNSIREIADCKVEKIFLDHRKLGFFRVKLLPVLVVQGVRLEFADANPTNEWAESFQSDWLPEVKRSAVEWRDVSMAFKKGKRMRRVCTPTGRSRRRAEARPFARSMMSRWKPTA